MKKIATITIILFLTMTASAQRRVVMDRNFNVSGKACAFCDKPNPQDCMDNMLLKDGISWHLKNTVLAGENFVEFWLSRDSDGKMLRYASWDQGITVILQKGEDGSTSYFVMDVDFTHLIVGVESNGNSFIHLCTILRE